ncbi:uncharacterized protein MYCGRDRAFT_110699 [Zymoseptoria tritici IPO323]|uniref:Uncharacterized protein n=1 Tax=Zymoseptoria tritici (strain CBS 115943 / IPO323) TaxID=336722 RepID=F9XJF7_ZYMTI|nr:uncharacterized protein MYCGRDRAFT_110699 [Zymoseptoria tritici IPO323]EGP84313.1 hypothetical protein MYCGRDRAFT_110699 [Zymoseptoria tritici IPO323]
MLSSHFVSSTIDEHQMEPQEEDDDLKLAKASAGLLNDLERDLPRVLWKASKPGSGTRKAHTRVRKRDLQRITSYIEPFQGEPQLLDAKLKTILPPIVDAYLEFLTSQKSLDDTQSDHLDFQTAVFALLYTLCKVRGQKIIAGFLNNEPRFLEPVLEAVERCTFDTNDREVQWQVPYVLLLWLSHLLLTPFDLQSISTSVGPATSADNDSALLQGLPPLISRILRVGLHHLRMPTKAQDAAAAMLVRLSTRPDVHKVRLADRLVNDRLPKLESKATDMPNMYEMLGSLRFVAGVASSAELSHLIPSIYRTCEKTFDESDESTLSSNAVAKKVIVKIFRNVAILSLRSVATRGPLLSFLQTTSVLENVIDYLLRSLGDKDTPVRYAAAKAMSLIVLELEPEMAHEVIQAVLDTFKEDMPKTIQAADFSTANPLKWHGLTLALAHTLFKRSASPAQLPDILDALISALQFQQRTATGSTLGTNVRDAANFGIWSLARRYTTAELLPVKANILHSSDDQRSDMPVVQLLAIQLILSACLDPAGNIRRGSSAAFQELVGRHPDQIHEGIALVQVVDYQAVSLRHRAMVDVASKAAAMHNMYWSNLLSGLLGWRGLGSADVSSRADAAESISQLSRMLHVCERLDVLGMIGRLLSDCSAKDVEQLHGLTLAAAYMLEPSHSITSDQEVEPLQPDIISMWKHFASLQASIKEFHPRLLKSELPASLGLYTTALCNATQRVPGEALQAEQVPFDVLDIVTDRLLARHEESILHIVPGLARSVHGLVKAAGTSLPCLEPYHLAQKLAADSTKSTLTSAGRAMAFGVLSSSYTDDGAFDRQKNMLVVSLCSLMSSKTVDWRVICARALQLAVNSVPHTATLDAATAQSICSAIHQGLNDYTIDERGDIGSLVRLQSITCTSTILSHPAFKFHLDSLQLLSNDIHRLSLEKLDRVRLSAAHCRATHLDLTLPITDIPSVSSKPYFRAALHPLTDPSTPSATTHALLTGIISSAGFSAESLLQSSRHVLATLLSTTKPQHFESLLTSYTTILADLLTSPSASISIHPALCLLSYILSTLLPHFPHLASPVSKFKWRTLLSTVQKAHHKSTDITRLMAAVGVYCAMAEVGVVRGEVLRKLVSMLKTNPFPRVRVAVAEVSWMVTGEETLLPVDWARPVKENAGVVQGLQKVLLD